mgnify:CR=1 FL=1
MIFRCSCRSGDVRSSAGDVRVGRREFGLRAQTASFCGLHRRQLILAPDVRCVCETAFIALVRSALEYGSVVWDPYLQKDIDKIERVQRNGARFITGDYKSRQEGAVTNMLKDLDLPSLRDRRTNAKLVFLYKVVEGLLPAVDQDAYIRPARPKRQIRAVKYKDCLTNRQETNNTRTFIVPPS